MKGKMQSLHLQEMMQQHKRHPEYDIVLPSFLMKKKKLLKLKVNDVLLLGLTHLELELHQNGSSCATVDLDSHGETLKVKIRNINHTLPTIFSAKKYEKITCSFGKIQSRQLEVGHKIEVSVLNMKQVTLYVDNTKIAEAKLVMVDEEIALNIIEVNDEKR